MSERLGNRSLGKLPKSVRVPAYDRAAVNPGIVHLGVGAFHRAHQAVYVDTLLADEPDWGIIGASLRRADTRDALAPQDGLYTVVSRGQAGDEFRVVGSLLRVLEADSDRAALMAALTNEQTRIVTLTITEKGYCRDPATGELDPRHPDIIHDLAHPDAPRSAPGVLVAALAMRRTMGRPAFTILSCDNLPANGATARRVVVGFAQMLDDVIGTWIRNQTAFPSTMVDRIVPATTDADRALVVGALGVADAWPVIAEPFSQWVIEDRFPSGRPRFENAGAEMVADVAPFELMKLRLLNGAHSSLAYLGLLAGFETVAEAFADPDLKAFVRRLMTEEVSPTLHVPGVDLAAYRDALMVRFANPALDHRTVQIAMDGSQKLPQRLLGTLRDRRSAGEPFDCVALGVAAWMRYATGIDEQGAKLAIRDPLADRLADVYAEAGMDATALVKGYLGIGEVFGRDLPADHEVVTVLARLLSALLERGARRTVREMLAAQR